MNRNRIRIATLGTAALAGAVGVPAVVGALVLAPANASTPTSSAAALVVPVSESRSVTRADVVQAKIAYAEVARAETARIESARAESARVEAARVEAARVEAARAEAARVEAARTEAARAAGPAVTQVNPTPSQTGGPVSGTRSTGGSNSGSQSTVHEGPDGVEPNEPAEANEPREANERNDSNDANEPNDSTDSGRDEGVESSTS